MTLDDWFLRPDERGNPHTDIDRRRGDGRACTTGNVVDVLVDGATYFGDLLATLRALAPGDLVLFTDWRGDADERLDGPGTEIGHVLADLARRGVDVRGLVWRSHSDSAHFSEKENRDFGQLVNEAGGEVLLDERVRRAGSHHQKLFVVQHLDHAEDDVAFVGGIDLSHGRRDDQTHRGDEQRVELDPRYGPQPAWHDAQLAVRGPAIADLAHTFHERWDDPVPLDHRVPWRMALNRTARQSRRPRPLPDGAPLPAPRGNHAVQVLRTYAAKRPPFPFAPDGERSVARAYLKALQRARALVYVEDQYLWSPDAADALASALRREPRLRVVVVVPRFPDRDGRFSGPPYRIGQERAMREVMRAGGDRVAVYDLEAETEWPIYVHAKVCIVDDVWLAVGSDNLNRRSWTNDSEVSCAVIDETLDGREPRDPGGLGDGARRLARETRLRLWGEHVVADADELLDPITGFDALARAATALEAWHADGRRGPRPAGRLRPHRPEPVRGLGAVWARLLFRTLIDPDGRPYSLRRAGEF
jgi:phosphatidylserine/phosphatidylglycerophosphate/cardiolipin synthase-like enzyme